MIYSLTLSSQTYFFLCSLAFSHTAVHEGGNVMCFYPCNFRKASRPVLPAMVTSEAGVHSWVSLSECQGNTVFFVCVAATTDSFKN